MEKVNDCKRLVLGQKGELNNLVIGLSSKPIKFFKKATICIKENNKIYKVISIKSSKDKSIYAIFPYCKEKKAYLFHHKHTYKTGIQVIEKSRILKEFKVNNATKLSLHYSGFVQVSEKNILSGVDKISGQPKGVGVFSSQLKRPVSSGPTFGFSCWGLEDGFELLTKRENNVQYIILDKGKKDFFLRTYSKEKGANTYDLEFFIFPEAANNFVYECNGEFFINHITSNIHSPGATLAYPVLDLKYFTEVICICPVLIFTGFADKSKTGYMIDSPGGSDNKNDKSMTGTAFHLICPGNVFFKQFNDLEELEYK